MARKSFKGYSATEGVEFDMEPLNGGSKLTVKGVPMIPGSVLLDFLSGVKDDDPGGLARTVLSLIQAAVIPEQWEDFRAFVDDPNNGVGLDTLSEIAGYLAEAYSGRPTSPQVPSTAG